MVGDPIYVFALGLDWGVFLFSGILCLAWIIHDWYAARGKGRRWSKYFLMTILVIQGIVGAWYLFYDEIIKALCTVLLCTGLYILFYVWLQSIERKKKEIK